MTTHALFPTLVYAARLQTASSSLNERLRRECLQLERDDAGGRSWSAMNYPGGYTSYGSACRMHERSPTFAELMRRLDHHVGKFVRDLRFEMDGRTLTMTDCWVNIMRRHVVHSLHLHPLATISGTYYVQTPDGSPGVKVEDPRLDRFMASPPRGQKNSPWITLPASTGKLVLFESWLRHEVPSHRGRQARISISFNYGWF